MRCLVLKSRHVRITSCGAVNVYAHVTSREHREDKRTTRPDTYIHIYKHSPRRGTHITINVGLAPIMVVVLGLQERATFPVIFIQALFLSHTHAFIGIIRYSIAILKRTKNAVTIVAHELATTCASYQL